MVVAYTHEGDSNNYDVKFLDKDGGTILPKRCGDMYPADSGLFANFTELVDYNCPDLETINFA